MCILLNDVGDIAKSCLSGGIDTGGVTDIAKSWLRDFDDILFFSEA